MRTIPVTLLLAGLAASAPADGKKIVPAQLAQARYVCLGYDTGGAFVSELQALSAPDAVFPEDRRALDAIRDEIERWGRYVITQQTGDAQLLIAVRAARRATISGGVGVGTGGRGSAPGGYPGGPSAGATSGGVEISSDYDMLTVYESRGGRPGAALWRVQGKRMLAGSPPKAFAELRDGVEAIPAPAQKAP